jgi:hypothetical protein
VKADEKGRYEKRKKEEGSEGKEMRRTRSDLLQFLEGEELSLDIR